MAYAPYGPFQDGVGTPPVLPAGAPPVNAAFLNALEAFLGTVTGGAFTPTPNVVNPVTGWYHCDAYGAVGDDSTNDRAAIQAAMDAAGNAYTSTGARQVVYLPPKTHIVDAVTYYDSTGTGYGAVSIMLRDGVTFMGTGTIKVKNSAYGSGALYAVIRSRSDGVSHATIRGITVDGNFENNFSSIQCSNIQLEAATDVEVSETRQKSCNGNGIMVRGNTTTMATNLRINRNLVDGCTAIGIQSSQFNGLEILGNTVQNTTDNSIDIYGENGSVNAHGINFRIIGNNCHNGQVGIFLETVAHGLCASNTVNTCSLDGIHVNRINGAPTAVYVEGNLCESSPNGIGITGDMGSVYVRNNTITNTTGPCIKMGGGGANLSHIYIVDNFLDTATLNAQYLISVTGGTNVWSQSFIRRTVTQNTNRAYDVGNSATTTTSNVDYQGANT